MRTRTEWTLVAWFVLSILGFSFASAIAFAETITSSSTGSDVLPDNAPKIDSTITNAASPVIKKSHTAIAAIAAVPSDAIEEKSHADIKIEALPVSAPSSKDITPDDTDETNTPEKSVTAKTSTPEATSAVSKTPEPKAKSTADKIVKAKPTSNIVLASAAPAPSMSDQSSTASLSDTAHLLQQALADQSSAAPTTKTSSAPPISVPAMAASQPSTASPNSLSDTSHLLQQALAEQSPPPVVSVPAMALPTAAAPPPPALQPIVAVQAPAQQIPALPPQPAPAPSPSLANATLTAQEAHAVQSQASNQALAAEPSAPSPSALVSKSPTTTVLADEPKDKGARALDDAKLTVQQEVTAQSLTAPANAQTDSTKMLEANATSNPRLTPSESVVKSEATAQWAEKLQILEQENIALRDKLLVMKPDSLSDIRVDVVTQIRENVLRARVSELEQELNKLHMAKEPDAAVPPVKASALSPKDKGAIPPPPPGKETPAVISKPLISAP